MPAGNIVSSLLISDLNPVLIISDTVLTTQSKTCVFTNESRMASKMVKARNTMEAFCSKKWFDNTVIEGTMAILNCLKEWCQANIIWNHFAQLGILDMPIY
ncbi:hypothetical protein L873DRAFT_1796063 [Choiromyces venosus 120613-1]|uniref:Uncharacterized protein n=1 Tax=Choiromyces venosus 120613-1 TaxID=1336337 RepID=A0A3N4IU71_9PEZI|nr:hypothetical protein L873DRAFT_1796063 [Choiromyces venosus 120613-1]